MCMQGQRSEGGMLILDEGQRGVVDLETVERGCHLIPLWREKNDPVPDQIRGKWLLNKHLDRWSYWELY